MQLPNVPSFRVLPDTLHFFEYFFYEIDKLFKYLSKKIYFFIFSLLNTKQIEKKIEKLGYYRKFLMQIIIFLTLT